MDRVPQLVGLLNQLRAELELAEEIISETKECPCVVRIFEPPEVSARTEVANLDSFFSSVVPAKPLHPSPGVYYDSGQDIGSTAVFDCLGLDAAEVKGAVVRLQKKLASGGISGVYVVSTNQIAYLVCEGVTFEVITVSDRNSEPGWREYVEESMEFIRRKYGVERMIRLQQFARAYSV